MLKCWTHAPSYFLTRESPGSCMFSPTYSALSQREGLWKWVDVCQDMCLCFQWPPTWCPFLSVLRFRQHRSQFLWQLPHSQNQKSEHCIRSPFAFPPPERSQVLGIFSWSHTELKGGSIMSVCRWFDVHLGWRSLYNWFLDFLQQELVQLVSGEGGRGLGASFSTIFLMSHLYYILLIDMLTWPYILFKW